ncbi:unnamed protein product [Arctia plantaginis]|uniref:Uncharacterized protein n=1 Tax=Arctia plantaginis TaxID=874455 RepID=A0A8S0ZBK4_ARCPL|nr:unnamed protein product [Arctia plantaginis]
MITAPTNHEYGFIFARYYNPYANELNKSLEHCRTRFGKRLARARQHGRQPAPPSPHPHSPLHPAPTGVRAFSCQHWESRLQAPVPARPLSVPLSGPPSPCDPAEVDLRTSTI